MKDIKAKIIDNRKVSGAYYRMTLDAPYIARNAKPGQFVEVRVSGGVEPLLRRPFSVHRVRSSEFGVRSVSVEVLYEVIGKGTEILSRKKTGESVDVLGPLGNGFSQPSAISHQLSAILVAGGIGVAPLVFLAEELAKKKIKTTVLIGAKTKNLILCEKDFKNIGAEVRIATDDGSRGYKGFVDKLFNRQLSTVNCQPSTIYACGPQPMLKCIAGMCRERGIECEVSLEEVMACGIGACLGCAVKVKGGGHKLVCKDGPVFNVTFLALQEM